MTYRGDSYFPDSTKGTGTQCERCGDAVAAYTGSYFNLETICLPCRALEEAHPSFPAAQRAETAAVRRGDYNYPGVGLPPGLREASLEARRARERRKSEGATP